MIKLYKRDEQGRLHYHEAWTTEDGITEHWGEVGTRGQTAAHPLDADEEEDEALGRILAHARSRGFEEIDEDDHRVLLIEFTVEGMGTESDVEKRYALQDRMDETLGWTGLGNCDGGSIGSGTMEVCCYVVDFAVAKRVVAEDLLGTPFADYTRIYDEDAEQAVARSS